MSSLVATFSCYVNLFSCYVNSTISLSMSDFSFKVEEVEETPTSIFAFLLLSVTQV